MPEPTVRKFWTITRPSGASPATASYETKGKARNEAERLVRRGRVTFVIMESIEYVRPASTELEWGAIENESGAGEVVELQPRVKAAS